jgi:hypothetical protein
MIRNNLAAAMEPYQVYAGTRKDTINDAEEGTHHGLAIRKVNNVLFAEKNQFVRLEVNDFDLAMHTSGHIRELDENAEFAVAVRIRRSLGRTDGIKNPDQVNIAGGRILLDIVTKNQRPSKWHELMGSFLCHDSGRKHVRNS